MNLKLHLSYSIMSAIIATLGSIVVAKLVGPHIYGELATFLAICAIISALASGRIETALFSAPESDLPQILLTGILNSLLACFLIAIFIELLGVINTPFSTYGSLRLIPILSFFASSNQCLRSYDAKVSYSQNIEPIKLISVVINYMTILMFSTLWSLTLVSLLRITTFSELCVFSLYVLINRKRLIHVITIECMRSFVLTAKKYGSHMAHDIPSAALNIFGQQAQIIALSTFTTPEMAGYYTLAKKPFVAISQFIMPPTTNHVRNIFLDSNEIAHDFSEYSKKLLILSANLGLLAVISTFLLINFMPKSYAPASVFIFPLLILSVFKNWISPLTVYMYIRGKVKDNLNGQLLYFFASIAPIALLIASRNSISIYVYLSSILLSLVYIYYYKLVKSYVIHTL